MKFTLVTCSQRTEEYFRKDSELGKCIPKLMSMHNYDEEEKIKIDFLIIDDNTKGLSECYNNAIDKVLAKETDKSDAIIFCHDDVCINDMFVLEKLEEAFKTYDVVGVAGTRKFSLNTMPVCWHASPKSFWGGMVCHPVREDKTNLQSNYYGPSPARAAVIDGLFMAIKTSAITPAIRFDETFTFDFYDADFCLNAVKNNLKIGISPIMITHMSHGEGIMKDRYRELQEKFVAKWKNKKENVME